MVELGWMLVLTEHSSLLTAYHLLHTASSLRPVRGKILDWYREDIRSGVARYSYQSIPPGHTSGHVGDLETSIHHNNASAVLVDCSSFQTTMFRKSALVVGVEFRTSALVADVELRTSALVADVELLVPSDAELEVGCSEVPYS